MKMWFSACIDCGARTSSVEGVCRDCEVLRTIAPAERRSGRPLVTEKRKRIVTRVTR